jgi:hypothetical protein
MVVIWRGDRPPACDTHGPLAGHRLSTLALDQLLDRRTAGEVA